MHTLPEAIRSIFPVSSRLMPQDVAAGVGNRLAAETLPGFLAQSARQLGACPFLPDLARIEWARHRVGSDADFPAAPVDRLALNPSLELLRVAWQGLPDLLAGEGQTPPRPAEDMVLVWKPETEVAVRVKSASGHDLLALKIASEQMDLRAAAAAGGTTLGRIDDIVYSAVQRGLLLSPPSGLGRPSEWADSGVDAAYLAAPTFTLQWHLTQACDLHCRHCYDRLDRPSMPLARAVRVLDELYDFCRQHHVYGQVSFTGGNPLLYPHFDTLYREAVDRGLLVGILGNPAPRARLERMCTVRAPAFYQVSLEGLPAHNDYIRGPGHFARVIEFLDVLRDLGIYSQVMLTLTAANLDQVLPLARHLDGRADLFTFNRLAPVGEGAALATAAPERWRDFLAAYLDAADNNAHIALKENLFNILLAARGRPLFGGCTGFGCGAAFNFVSLLPDGEVHACRKFPSPIGHLDQEPLAAIYASARAERYRRGSAACEGCRLRPVCGGCLAVTHGLGDDPFADRDRYCFIQ